MKLHLCITTIIAIAFNVQVFGQIECVPRLTENSVIRNNYRQSTTSSLAQLKFNDAGGDSFLDVDGSSPLFRLSGAKAIWAGGYGPSGNLKLAASTYGVGGRDYKCGPLWRDFQDPAGLCAFYKRVWSIDKTALVKLKESYDTGLLDIQDIPLDILEWPAKGNPHISEYAPDYDMAPFYDNDQDAIYNPLAGDHPIPLEESPAFIPTQFRFYVINDNTIHKESDSETMQMEFHILDYVIDCGENNESNTSIFSRLKYIYRGVEDLRDFKIGIWNDSALGCDGNDYVGCQPALNATYVYNRDGNEMDYPFSSAVPDNYGVVNSLVFLNTELESFIHYYNAAVGNQNNFEQIDPQIPQAYFEYLNGRWVDGSQMTIGGTGLNPGSDNYTLYAFPDLPTQNAGWSMQSVQTMDSDIRTISVFSSQDLLKPENPFEVETKTFDFVDHVMIDQDKTGLNIFEDYEERINNLKQEFADMKNGSFVCGPLPEGCQFDCVWPGDVNNDGFVSGKDMIILGNQIGLGGGSGPARTPQSSLWFPFSSSNWDESTVVGNDAKHADVDGNGAINNSDFSDAENNIGESRIEWYPNVRLEENSFDNILSYELDRTTVDAATTSFFDRLVNVDVRLGDLNEALEKPVHGLTYEIKIDTSLAHLFSLPYSVPNDFEEADFNAEQWIYNGTGFSGDNRLLFYQTNLNGQNIINGQALSELRLRIREDAATNNPNGLDTLVLKFYNVFGTNAAGEEVQFGTKYDSIFISNLIYDPNLISKVDSEMSKDIAFKISPNPVENDLDVSLAQPETGELTIYSITGALLSTHQFRASDHERVPVQDLNAGLYIMSLRIDDRMTSTKFIKL